jgi:hypothetical protein
LGKASGVENGAAAPEALQEGKFMISSLLTMQMMTFHLECKYYIWSWELAITNKGTSEKLELNNNVSALQQLFGT